MRVHRSLIAFPASAPPVDPELNYVQEPSDSSTTGGKMVWSDVSSPASIEDPGEPVTSPMSACAALQPSGWKGAGGECVAQVPDDRRVALQIPKVPVRRVGA